MPPRPQPKVYQLLLKTHKLTIFVTASPTKTIASLKDEALSALVSDINQAEHVPKITQEGEFEICRAIKERGKSTGEYEILDPSKQVKELGISGWEHLYFQFRDPSGDLLPVTFTQPNIDDDDEMAPQPEMEYPSSSKGKGKRKARSDDEDDF